MQPSSCAWQTTYHGLSPGVKHTAISRIMAANINTSRDINHVIAVILCDSLQMLVGSG